MKEWKGEQKYSLLIFSFLLIVLCFHRLPAEWIEDANQNLPVCTAAEDQHFPDLISDNHGGVIVAWRDVRNGNRDVFAQRISTNGEILWEDSGIPICVQPSAQSWPLLIPDAEEGTILVFGDSRHRNRDIYAQRIDANGELLWGEDGVPVSTAPFLKEDVKAISDGEGGAIIVWEDSRHGNLDVYAQRIDGSGKPVWELNGVPVYKERAISMIHFWRQTMPVAQSSRGGTSAHRIGTSLRNGWVLQVSVFGEMGVFRYVQPPAIREVRLWSPMVRAERLLSGQTTAMIRIFSAARISTPNALMQMGRHSGRRMVSISVMTRRISSSPEGISDGTGWVHCYLVG